MTAGDIARDDAPHMHGFERLLTLWVLLCMAAGIALGRIAPGFAKRLDGMTLDDGDTELVAKAKHFYEVYDFLDSYRLALAASS